MLSTQPYKGARDFFPEDIRVRNYIFETWRAVCTSFGFEEYDAPFIEPFELFASKTGEEIVNEQLYWFIDRGDRKVAIRPEMTPSVSRMAAEKIRNQYPTPIKWFSIANFWRYEKPQKGRGREFYQLNADIFGEESVEADFEILALNAELMKAFGAKPSMYQVRVNNRYLINYLFEEFIKADKNFWQKIAKAIDRRPKISQADFESMLSDAGLSKEQISKTNDMLKLTVEDLKTFSNLPSGARQLLELFELISTSKIPSVVYDPTIVRGFDYYDGNVFEQFDMTEGNNRSMFGGGRYDGLISLFIEKKVPAVGFAPGDITLLEFLKSWDLLPNDTSKIDLLMTVFPDNQECKTQAYTIAQNLREKGINIETFLNPKTDLAKQVRYADRKGVNKVAILGPEEFSQNKVLIKNLKTGNQIAYFLEPIDDLVKALKGATL